MQVFHDNIELNNSIPFGISLMSLKPHYDMGYMHWHDCFEISCIIAGDGIYYVEDKEYPVTAGDTVIINNVEPHRLAVGKEPFEQLVMVFHPRLIWSGGNSMDYSYLVPFNDHGAGFNNLVAHKNSLSDEINTLIWDIYKEYLTKTEGWELMIKAKLMSLLTILYRHYRNEQKSEGRKNLLRLSKVFEYIETDFSDTISLNKAAELMHFTPQYFSVFFKKCIGVGFIEYVVKTRIDYAITLLKTTDQKVIYIAQQCGFHNIGNFNEMFKKYTGTTPSMIRKKN